MAFKDYKYEFDSGAIGRIRLSAAIKAVSGAEAVGTISDARLRASTGVSRRKRLSITARHYVYTFSETTAGGLSATTSIRLPVMSKDDFPGNPAATVTYQGRTYNYASAVSEG